MVELRYTPDDDLQVHEEGAIRLICSAFQSHEAGLPEWIKNSADAYARENAPPDKRVVVVIFDYGRPKKDTSISCLDFCGMTSKVIEESFRVWADPEASTRGGRSEGVQGGHGNGGKCYMTQMFEKYSLVHTVKFGSGNRYGVSGGSFRFGYVPNREEGRDFPVRDLGSELDSTLVSVRCSLNVLPDDAKHAFSLAQGFSFVTGVAPKDYSQRIAVDHLVSSLEQYPQMIQTLQMCRVCVMVNGRPLAAGKPLSLPEIRPMEGAAEPRVLDIPAKLEDPRTGEKISTTEDGKYPQGTLTLRTSEKSMRWNLKGRHNVTFKAQSGYIGYVEVLELNVQSEYRNRIYGECHLDSLERFKQNDRARLATSSLTRAVEHYISRQIQDYANEFEALERRLHDQEEKNLVKRLNEALDEWKNRLLDEIMSNLWGTGTIDGPPPRQALPSGKAVRIELSLSHQRAGVGVAFRPALRFYNSKNELIRPVPFEWISEDTNVAMVDGDLMVINTFAFGRTQIYARTLDNRLQSNKAPLDVVCIHGITIQPNEVQVPERGRTKLEAICSLVDGVNTPDVLLQWIVDNPSVARVSSSGLVYGVSQGQTEVVAGDDRCEAAKHAVVKVVEGIGRGPGKKGKGHPVVLISGVDADPETGAEVSFRYDDPPVHQRVEDVDLNIWWINSSSPLAKLYSNKSRGYGYDSREWRMYHLERYIDVIVQIAVTHGPQEAPALSVDQWIGAWGQKAAEVQLAAATELGGFIDHGDLPS